MFGIPKDEARRWGFGLLMLAAGALIRYFDGPLWLVLVFGSVGLILLIGSHVPHVMNIAWWTDERIGVGLLLLWPMLSIAAVGTALLYVWPLSTSLKVSGPPTLEALSIPWRDFRSVQPIPKNHGTLIAPIVMKDILSARSETGKIEVGDSGTYLDIADPTGAGIKWLLGESKLVVEEDAGGRLYVSTDVKDPSGKAMATLVRNEWKTAKQRGKVDRNYDNTALEIIDAAGEVALQIQMVPGHIQLQGKWYYSDGKQTTIMKSHRPGYSVIQFASTPEQQHDPSQPYGIETIHPIFRYPSTVHLGERLAK